MERQEVDKKEELLEIYDMRENFLGLQKRGEFYVEIDEEYAETRTISKQVRSIRAIIMNSHGRIYLQERAENKSYNAGLYDKTLGGHCNHRQKADLALVAELAEELESPGFVCPTPDFLFNLSNIDLKVVGLFKDMGYQSGFMSMRQGNKELGNDDICQPFMSHFYFGVFDGRFSWVDGEVRGMRSYTLRELEKELERKPDIYTQDLQTMLPMYREDILNVLDRFELDY